MPVMLVVPLSVAFACLNISMGLYNKSPKEQRDCLAISTEVGGGAKQQEMSEHWVSGKGSFRTEKVCKVCMCVCVCVCVREWGHSLRSSVDCLSLGRSSPRTLDPIAGRH